MRHTKLINYLMYYPFKRNLKNFFLGKSGCVGVLTQAELAFIQRESVLKKRYRT